MNKQQRDFYGSSIHGQKLKVYFKGDGVLSSSFVIERSRESSFHSLVFILPCIIAIVAVNQEFLSLTNFLVSTFVLFVVVLLKLYCFDVHRESVLIVKDLGVQFTRSGVLGLETSQFIEHHRIVDVLINEVITMHQVVFYLTLLTCDGTQSKPDRNQQLHPLFTASVPCLETIKPIYHGMQQILGTG
ncbi:phosphatidylinositol N-acetylglucosaminyltransferase subunit H-like [Oculina patagonica]